MADLASVVVVESAGQSKSPVAPEMHSLDDRRIAILVNNDERPASVQDLILRAVGKRRRSIAKTRTAEWTPDRAMRWLLAEEIDDIFVGAAERLESNQLSDLLLLSGECRVWFLYSEDCSHREHFLRASIPTARATRDDALARCSNASQSSLSWDDFPSLPLAEPLQFRSRCKAVLTAVELERVDVALDVGVTSAFGALRESPPSAEAVTRRGFESAIPMWPALAMLRGAQLAAFTEGWRLSFDVESWVQIRSTTASLDARVIAAIRECSEPREGTLAAIRVLSQADARAIAAMRVADVSEDGSSFYCAGGAHAVPDEVQSTFRAYILDRAAALNSPLFVVRDDFMFPTHQMRSLIKRTLLRFGMPPHVQHHLDQKFGWETNGVRAAVNLRLERQVWA